MPINPLPLSANQNSADLRANMQLMAAFQAATNFKCVAAYYMQNITNSTTDGGILGTNAGDFIQVEFKDTEPSLLWDPNIGPFDFPLNIGEELLQTSGTEIKIPETGTYMFIFTPLLANYYEEMGSTSNANGAFNVVLYVNGSLNTTYDYHNGSTVSYNYYQRQLVYMDSKTFNANDVLSIRIVRSFTTTNTTRFKGAYDSNLDSTKINHSFLMYRAI